MTNQQIVLLAPVRPAAALREWVKGSLKHPHLVGFADSFSKALTMEFSVVIVIEPTDKPQDHEACEIIIQTHSINEVSRLSSILMETGATDTEITRFSRRMGAYSRYVSSLSQIEGVDVNVVRTASDDYEPIWDAIVWRELERTELTEEVPPTEEPPTDSIAEVPEEAEEASESFQPPEEVSDLAEAMEITEGGDFGPLELLNPPLEFDQATPVTPISAESLDFDPVEAAFNSSVKKANEEFDEPTSSKVEQTEYTLDTSEALDYPKVNSTVHVPLKLLQDSVNKNAAYFSDWAGSQKTYNRIFDRIDSKLSFAINNGRQPRLDDFERHVVMIADDSVANEPLHNQQYVDGSNWSGYVQSQATNVPIITPIRNPENGDARYVGPEGVSLIQNRMKIGCKLGVFLPHTGIYFIVNSPGDEDLLNTLSIINNYRVEALRASSGILLGNSNFYLYRQVLNLFINNISACSLVNWNKEVIIDLIDERDINIIATLLMATVYPDGYEYRQACGIVKDNKPCEHITSKLVDLRRLVFIDNSRLSETQRNIPVGGLRARSIGEIKSYQETNYIGFKKAYEITDGISFVYKAQSINTVIAAGEQWIKEIEAVVDSVVTFNQDEETRNNEIRQRINLSRIREYSHWVNEIQIDGETNVITDRAGIEKLLSSLSRNQKVLDKVSETLAEFQRLSLIAIVAIPRVTCPVCQSTDPKDLDISPHLIPQDAVSRFFTLARQRLS